MHLQDTVSSLKAAADPTRLRLLTLLAAGEATVGELQQAVEQSQPRVSRHLKILCAAGLADKFRDGTNVYYRLPAQPAVRAFVSVLVGRMSADEPILSADRDNMVHIRRKRARVAWSDRSTVLSAGRGLMPGLAGEDDLAAAFAEVPGDLGRLLDIGTGTGTILCHLAPRAAEATGVDVSQSMRIVARTRVREAGLANCTVRKGDMAALPFGDDSFDTVLLDQVLTLTGKQREAINEAARVLKPGGIMLVLDRIGPVKGSLTTDYGPEGLAENQLAVMLAEAGLRSARRRDLAGRLPGFALVSALPMIESGAYVRNLITDREVNNYD